MLLKMTEHLKGGSLSEFEAAVPDRLVEEMWPRVELDIMRDEWRKKSERGRPRVWRWVVAAQAAAIVLLAVGAAMLFGELNKTQRSETALTEQMAMQEQRLAAVERWTSTTTAQTAHRMGGTTWQRQLADMENVTVAEAVRYLERLPEDDLVLDVRGAKRLMMQLPYAVSGARPAALTDIRTDDGLQAGEALRLIAALDLNPSQQFPAGRITGLSRRYY
jgi:Tfp pilus assembly protein PilN